MKRIENETEDIFANMTDFQRSMAMNSEAILAEFLFDPWEEGLDGMLKAFIEMLRRMLAELVAQQLITSFLGAFGGPAGNTPAASTPAPRRHGGPVNRGGAFLVGEGGPELFTPGATGQVRPLGQLNFESNTTIGGGGGLDIATLLPILEENNKKLKAELFDAFDRGTFN